MYGNRGKSVEFLLIPENKYVLFSKGDSESGRHPRGFLEPVGSILVEYEPEPSHVDLIQTNFPDFVPNLNISVSWR